MNIDQQGNPDLDFVSTESMIAELKKRHDALIIVGLKDIDSNRIAYLLEYEGGDVLCLGLAEYASTKFRYRIIEFEEQREAEGQETDV